MVIMTSATSWVFVLFAGIACFGAGAIGCEESCDRMTTESYLLGDLTYVQSEAEAVSRANAEEWSALTDTSDETDGESFPRGRATAPLSSYGGTFDPARACAAGVCMQVWNEYATFAFTRPTTTGTFALEDLQATLCEHASNCPTVEERDAGAMCDYAVERCVEVRGEIVVARNDASCGEDACGGFVADIDVHTLDAKGPTISGKTRINSVEKILHQQCGGGGGGCAHTGTNPMH
jgi:hypothetical protein